MSKQHDSYFIDLFERYTEKALKNNIKDVGDVISILIRNSTTLFDHNIEGIENRELRQLVLCTNQAAAGNILPQVYICFVASWFNAHKDKNILINPGTLFVVQDGFNVAQLVRNLGILEDSIVKEKAMTSYARQLPDASFERDPSYDSYGIKVDTSEEVKVLVRSLSEEIDLSVIVRPNEAEASGHSSDTEDDELAAAAAASAPAKPPLPPARQITSPGGHVYVQRDGNEGRRSVPVEAFGVMRGVQARPVSVGLFAVAV